MVTCRISVVTPVLNGEPYIADAIESVAAQDYPAHEHIVVDGGSTDGTLERLRRCPGVRLVSAPGSGLYEAINIGIGVATGDCFGHLNSDDILEPGALARVAQVVEREPGVEAVRGVARYFTATEEGTLTALPALDAALPRSLRLADVTRGVPAINAVFIMRRAYARIGYYDASLRLAADRDWLWRALAAGVLIRNVDAPVYRYRVHNRSLTLAPGRPSSLAVDEHLQLIRRHWATADDAARRELLRWHAKEQLQLLRRCFALGFDRRSLTNYLRQAIAFDPWWILRIGPFVAEMVLRFVQRRFRIGRSAMHSPRRVQSN